MAVNTGSLKGAAQSLVVEILKATVSGGVRVKVGDIIKASRRDANVLIGAGKAVISEVKAKVEEKAEPKAEAKPKAKPKAKAKAK